MAAVLGILYIIGYSLLQFSIPVLFIIIFFFLYKKFKNAKTENNNDDDDDFYNTVANCD